MGTSLRSALELDIQGREGILELNSTQRASLSNEDANQAGSFFIPMKSPLTIDAQIEHLKQSGFSITDAAATRHCLEDLNYYRLRPYWSWLECDGKIAEGTPFELVVQTYALDTEIREWLWSAILSIEIKARSQFAYSLALAAGPLAYRRAEMFSRPKAHEGAIRSIDREIDRAKRANMPCVVHNLDKYGDLPIWAACELMTMGTISSMIGNLKSDAQGRLPGKAIIREIADGFRTTPTLLKSWLRHLTMVRNTCAHHNRFYGRILEVSPKLLKCDSPYFSKREFPTFLVLKRLYERSWPERWPKMAADLGVIVDAYPEVSLAPMGFPQTWREVLDVPTSTETATLA